jgi:hypothetical protein
MQSVTYRRKRGVVSRGECEWRVEDDALVLRNGGGNEQRTPWKDVMGVRLYQEASRHRPWRYAFELHTRQGARIIIDNAHCRTRRDYEDRSGAYTPFVRAALARIAAANPNVRLLIGETQRRYFFLMLASLLGMGVLAFALIAVPTPLDGMPFALPVKLGLILLLLPAFWLGLFRIMPRGVPLDQVPDHVLPDAPLTGSDHSS